MQDKFITEALERYTQYIACLESLQSCDLNPIREYIAEMRANPVPRLRGGCHKLNRVRDCLEKEHHRWAIIELKGLIGDEFDSEDYYVQRAVMKIFPAHTKALLKEALAYSRAIEQSRQAESFLGNCNRSFTAPEDFRKVKRLFRQSRRVMFNVWGLTDAQMAQAEQEDSDYLSI